MGTSKLLGDNLAKCWEVTPSRGSRNTPSRFILQKPELSAGTDEPSAPITIGADFTSPYLTYGQWTICMTEGSNLGV